MSVLGKAAALIALLAAGVLLAGAVAKVGSAQDTTTTATTTLTTTEATTEATTVTATTTLQQTTTRSFTVPTTTSSTSNSSGTPTWVWVLVGILAVALVVLVVVMLTRHPSTAISAAERARLLDAAVDSWVVQGWAIQSKSPDSAVLLRESEQMLVSIDPNGRITSQPLSGSR